MAGRDGWLFWIGTAGQNLRLYRNGPGARYLLWRWRRLVLERARFCREGGIRFIQLLIPDKLSIYDDKLVGREVDPEMSFALRLGHEVAAAGLPETCVDLNGPLRAARDGAELYLRTDTHFTPAGYRLAYRTLCEACGASPQPHVLAGTTAHEEIDTDLGSKLQPPQRELCEVYRFDLQAVRAETNALVRHREGQLRQVPGISAGSRIVYSNPTPGIDGRRVTVFGDSYTFHETGLGAMLAETFREVHLLWSSPLDLDYIRRVKPDLVVHEIAERFVRRVPRDGVSVDALAEKRLAVALAAAGARTT